LWTDHGALAKRRLEVLRHSQDANFLWKWRKTRAAGAAQDVPRASAPDAGTMPRDELELSRARKYEFVDLRSGNDHAVAVGSGAALRV
jgi:hypothetical protein